MVEALPDAAPGASAAWFTAADGHKAFEAVVQADVVVIGRALYTTHVSTLIARARAAGRRVLLDVDDLVFDLRYARLVMETVDQTDDDAYQLWYGWIARLGATLELCDGAVTTNELLAQRVREFHDVPTHVVPIHELCAARGVGPGRGGEAVVVARAGPPHPRRLLQRDADPQP